MSAPKIWDDRKLKVAVELRRMGWNYTTIAEATGFDRSQVRNRIYRNERGDDSWYEERKKPRPRHGRKTRNCLCCTREFSSSWIGNRLCLDCKARGHAPLDASF